MKTVYADVVLLLNFILDYVILLSSAHFLNVKYKKSRMLLSALSGAVFSLFCIIFFNGGIVSFTLAILFLPIMCLICFGKRKLPFLLKICLSMYLFSIMLCGIVMFISCAVYGDYINGANGFLICSFSAAVMLAFLKCFGRGFYHRLSSANVKVTIEYEGAVSSYSLMVDTGNFLVDPYNACPVIILGKSQREKLTDKALRLMPLTTVTGKQLVEVFTPQRVTVKNSDKRASVCFVEDENLNKTHADGLIPQILVSN